MAGQTDLFLSEMPKGIVDALKRHLRDFGLKMNLIFTPNQSVSTIDYTSEGDIAIYFGRDVYDGIHLDDLALRDLLASAIVIAGLQTKYRGLATDAPHNENAWLKLEVIKGLLNYRARLPLYHRLINRYNWSPDKYWGRLSPSAQRELSARYNSDLDRFTQGLSSILSWNLFVNVMDDADPAFMIANYLQILQKDPGMPTTEPAVSDMIERLIERVEQADVPRRVSFAHLRNVMKEFFYSGIARVPEAGQVKMDKRYKQFDDTEKIVEWKNTLLSA